MHRAMRGRNLYNNGESLKCNSGGPIMKLTVECSDGEVVHVACADDITLCDFAAGENPLEQALGKECYTRKVVLSLQKSCYIDSAGIGWLVMCHKRFRDARGCLVLHSIPPMVQHVFTLLGLVDVLNMASDEAQAESLALA
jgi:anti-anti-sigma factor